MTKENIEAAHTITLPGKAREPSPPWQKNALGFALIAVGGFLIFIYMESTLDEGLPAGAWTIAGGLFVKLMDGVVDLLKQRRRQPAETDSGED